MPGARLKSFKLMPEDMLDMSQGVRAELEFSVDGMTATGSGKSMVTVPWIGKSLGVVNFILGGTGWRKENIPCRPTVACGLKEDISIQLGDGFAGAVSMPILSAGGRRVHELPANNSIINNGTLELLARA